MCLSIAVYKLRLPDASQHNMHNDMCHVASVTACYSVPRHRCIQARGTVNCVPGPSAKATACDSVLVHSIAVYKLRLPYASQRRHNELRRVAKRDCKPRHATASLCTGQRHHKLCGEGSHLRRRASDLLCRSCAYLMRTGTGTMECAMMQGQPHATASLSTAEYKPKAL